MKDRKVFCLNNISPAGTDRFRPGYTLTDSIGGAAGVLVRSADMHGIEFPAGLRAIARAGAGVNNIPIERCSEGGIVVFNTPGANANSVKELVVCGLLLASRDVCGGIEWVANHQGETSISREAERVKKVFAGHELVGKTLGVMGLGSIGVLVANAAVALGMRVCGYDPYISVKSAWRLSPMVALAESAEEVWAASDYLTLHVPATEETIGIIDKDALEHMRRGAVVLNFARDSIVDERAMAEALASGQVRRYVSDFPNEMSSSMKGAIVIPHLGASTEEAEENCAIMAVEQLQDYLDNGNIRNSVNYPEVNLGMCATGARVAILHRNVPNMLSQITSFFGSQGLSIESMARKGSGGYAYTLMDISSPMPHDTVGKLRSIDGVLRVRRVVG